MFTLDRIDRQALQELVDNAVAWEIDVDAIFRRLGVEYAGGAGGISIEQYLQLQTALTDAIRHAVHSRLGQRELNQEEYEIAFHYMIGADDLGDALLRMKKFATMLAERLGDGAIHLRVDQSLAHLYIRPGVTADLLQRFAAHFTREHHKLIEMMAWMIGTPIPVVRLDVPFAATATTERQLQRFPCPISYGHSGFRYFFPATLLRKPIVRTAQELKIFLKIFPAVFHSSDRPEQLALDQRIERILEKQCLEGDGLPTASELASAMNMSEATLRRRLRDAGRSFSAIKQGCQLRLGKKFLATSNRNLNDVAHLLGYQDVNAFRRAFKQATGHTPMGYREHYHRGGDRPDTERANHESISA